MTTGNGYRAKALELLDKADGETDSRMRAEFENLPEKKSIQNLSVRRLPASIYKRLAVPKRSSLWRNNTATLSSQRHGMQLPPR